MRLGSTLLNQRRNYNVVYSTVEDAKFQDYCLNLPTIASMCWTFIKPIVIISSIVFPMYLLPFPEINQGFISNGILPMNIFIAASFASSSGVFSFQHFFPEYKITYKEIMLISCSGGMCYVLCLAVLTQICYPFPFSIIIPGNASVPVLGALCYQMLVKKVKHLTHFLRNLKAFLLSLCLSWMMLVIYPASFQALHVLKSEDYITETQLGFAMYLFILRHFFKKALIRLSEYAKRPAPVLTVIVVYGYHAVYLSIMLQDNIQWITLTWITLVDVLGKVLDFMNLKKLTKVRKVSTSKVSSELSTRRHCEEPLVTLYADALVLIEYVECVVPVLLALFSCCMLYLSPNRKFMMLYNKKTDDEMLQDQLVLWLYAFIEIGTLLVIIPIFIGGIKYPFWKRLAFVLQENMVMTISLLTSWVFYSLGSSLTHYSTDWKLVCNDAP